MFRPVSSRFLAIACLGVTSAWANFEVDVFDTTDTFNDPNFGTINFRQTFDRAPVVFVLPTDQGGDSGLIRIQNVSTTGFEAIVTESPGEDGPHVAMTNVTYIAIQPGLYEIAPGVFLDAGVWDTQTAILGPAAFGSAGGWDNVEFRRDFGATPAVLATVQTLNNETANIPNAPSSPFMSATVNSIGVNNFDVAIERAETNDGSLITNNETIGYLALQDTTGSFLDNGANTINWEAFLSSDSIRGWDEGGDTINFNNSYSSAPLVGATMSTRDGNNGGWLRNFNTSSSGVTLAVDEDVFFDAERSHTTERASIAAFSEAFDATLTRRTIDITWNGQNAAGLWTTPSNWRRWNGHDRNLQDGDVFLFNNAGSGVTNSVVNFNYTPRVGGITFEQSTSYNITASGGSLQLENLAAITNNSSVAQSIDVDLTAHGSFLVFNSGTTAGGSLSFGPNGVIDLSDTGGAALYTFGANDMTISGEITGAGGSLVKFGSGNLTLDGAASNTYTGTTTVFSGELELAKTGGATAIAGDIEILGGTLLLGGDEQIANTSAMNLNGGTFATAGFDESLGALTLSNNSEIDLSGGDSVISFDDSSGETWSGGTLTITGWSGSANGGGAEQLFFGSDINGLDPSQVGMIQFFNPAGFAPGTYSARLLPSGELVPVPEPGTYAMGAAVLAACLWHLRRRRQ